jgi:hypothetical protein
VAEDVVDLLEAVQVYPEHGHATLAECEGAIESCLEHVAVREARQRVVEGAMGQFVLEALLLALEPLVLTAQAVQLEVDRSGFLVRSIEPGLRDEGLDARRLQLGSSGLERRGQRGHASL